MLFPSVGDAISKAIGAEAFIPDVGERNRSPPRWIDLASSANLPQEDRTVAALAPTVQVVNPRDTAYQRGFPMVGGVDGPPVDRGHPIPHLSGGESGPNIFREDRALNRGWSEQGKRYRALEREAAATLGTLYFGHLIYADDTAYPYEIETGLLRGDKLHVERFHTAPWIADRGQRSDPG